MNIYLPSTSLDGTTGGVEQVPSTASGSVTPTQIFVDSIGGLTALLIDGSGNYYAIEHTPVAGALGTYAIAEFAAGAKGTTLPIRRISGLNTGLILPYALASDGTGGMYVAQSHGISYFGPTQSGDVAPLRTISGSATGLDSVARIVLHPSGDVSVVNLGSDGYTVKTFAAGAYGNVSPKFIVASYPFGTLVDGLALDAQDHLFVASTFITAVNNVITSFTPTIQEFAPSSTQVILTISPTSNNMRVTGMAFDQQQNILVYTNDVPGNSFIEKFAATASGKVTSISEIALSSGNNKDGSIALF